jgi:hypothetical protein
MKASFWRKSWMELEGEHCAPCGPETRNTDRILNTWVVLGTHRVIRRYKICVFPVTLNDDGLQEYVLQG